MARRPANDRSSPRGGSRSSKKKTTVSVNFKDVETFTRMDEGEQTLKVTECTLEKGDAGDYIKWVLENEDGARAYHNTSLSEKSLWNAKAWLEALGVEVPDDEMDIDLEEMIDLELMAQIEHETYQGKKQSKIVDFWPVEDAKPKERGSSRRGDKDKDGDKNNDRGGRGSRSERPARGKKEEPKPPTDEELDDMSEDELADVVKDFDLDVDLDKYRTLTKKINAVKEALAD